MNCNVFLCLNWAMRKSKTRTIPPPLLPPFAFDTLSPPFRPPNVFSFVSLYKPDASRPVQNYKWCSRIDDKSLIIANSWNHQLSHVSYTRIHLKHQKKPKKETKLFGLLKNLSPPSSNRSEFIMNVEFSSSRRKKHRFNTAAILENTKTRIHSTR